MSGSRAFGGIVCSLAWLLSACGGGGGPGGGAETEPSAGGAGGVESGTGGSGGAPGEGGAGGSGGGGALPAVEAFVPDAAGRGFRVQVVGKNLNPGGPNNAVYFVSQAGSEEPNIESVGLTAAADGSSFEVLVPAKAHTGPTRVVVKTPEGKITLEGPAFTVTDATLPPRVEEVTPVTFTQGEADAELEIRGRDFYRERTKVLADEAELPVDWSRSDETKLVASLPGALLATAGELSLTVENPEPGGGRAGPHALQVVPPLRLLSVVATGPTALVLSFDRAVNRSAASATSNFRVEGIADAIAFSRRRLSDSTEVDLQLREPLEPAETYTLALGKGLVSTEGGGLATARMEFVAFDPRRELLAELGGPDCGPSGFFDPTGLTLAGDRLYVVERAGGQVQVVDVEGNLLGYYGDDGGGLGYHEAGAAAGCDESAPGPDGLVGPIGRAVVTEDGEVFVGDSGKGRVVAFDGDGTRVVVDGLPTPAVLLGWVPGQGLAVTAGTGRFEIYDPATGELRGGFGGEPGPARDAFDLRMDEGGIPSLTPFRFWVGDALALVEPGNHRVSRLTEELEARGSVGSGSTSFFGVASGEPGTEAGSFTAPTGLAADAEGQLYVVDSAGGSEGGGRLQLFERDGRLVWQMKLDYLPGGVAVDEERGYLWITNRSRSTLMKYRL